ncbi:hypothetical protein [Nocardia flavorosea]|uniref:Uncharacterized protein n=1 Tax=Nocardia flavorosea TaxID=53429 RepID=A0A846YKI9_9NOCA|nr:hypothetical protein [Nocardia flavorosea]NKY57419.1 hypothetical protein [Nocardia flavorosea]
MRHSLRTFAAAVSIAAAGLAAAGTAAAAPVQLTPAAPIQDDGGAEAGTGSADALLPLLPQLLSGSAAGENANTSDEAGTGSAESLGPLLELLAAGSSGTQGTE